MARYSLLPNLTSSIAAVAGSSGGLAVVTKPPASCSKQMPAATSHSQHPPSHQISNDPMATDLRKLNTHPLGACSGIGGTGLRTNGSRRVSLSQAPWPEQAEKIWFRKVYCAIERVDTPAAHSSNRYSKLTHDWVLSLPHLASTPSINMRPASLASCTAKS
ncbi:hypothetical protein KCU65_g170, partial [Aureobasidium melanogenum]